MRTPFPALTIFALGLITFGLVFLFLAFSPSAAEPGQVPASETATPTALELASDSLEPAIAASNLAIGVPIAGSEALLRNVQPGDRLDIMASFSAPQSGPPLTVVLVRGATVLRSASQSDPLLVQVAAPDALMMAHVILRGTHLGYILWPANGSIPAGTPAPIDEQTARNALGLTQPTAAATLLPTPTVVPPTALPTNTGRPASGFLYEVQPNDTWASIATIFGLSVDDLRQVNESTPGEPQPGMLVFIPRMS